MSYEDLQWSPAESGYRPGQKACYEFSNGLAMTVETEWFRERYNICIFRQRGGTDLYWTILGETSNKSLDFRLDTRNEVTRVMKHAANAVLISKTEMNRKQENHAVVLIAIVAILLYLLHVHGIIDLILVLSKRN